MRGTAALVFLATGIIAVLFVYLPGKSRSKRLRVQFTDSLAAQNAEESNRAARLWIRQVGQARRLAGHIARSPDLDPLLLHGATPETVANALAPYVPFPYAAILVFDDAGEVLARVRIGGEQTAISAAETAGIEEAGLAEAAVFHFDNERRLIRLFEPVFRDGKRRGFLCFEIDALPAADWFLATSNRVLIAPTSAPDLVNVFYRPNGRLEGVPTTTWEIEGIGHELYLCRMMAAAGFCGTESDAMALAAAFGLLLAGSGAGYLLSRRSQAGAET